jgi:thioredoxin 1
MAKGKKQDKKEKIEVKEISTSEFDSIIRNNNIVIVDFFTEWCMPCLMMVPVIDELAQLYAGKVCFVKINVDENSEVASRFKVMSIPTLIVFKKGNEVGRITGASSYDTLKSKIEQYLKS